MFKYLISLTWRKKRRHVQDMFISLNVLAKNLSVGNILDVRVTAINRIYYLESILFSVVVLNSTAHVAQNTKTASVLLSNLCGR
jgi:hypothetical protein